MTTKILVVCTGNICRSPMGEVVLREKLAQAGVDAEVDSVGVSAEESGNPIDRRARRVLSEHGYEVPNRSARRVTARDLEESDLVLAMTAGHARSLRDVAIRAGVDLAKIHLWREYDPSADIDIAPGGAFGEGGALDSDGGDRGYSNFYSFDGDWDVPDPWYGSADGFYDTLEVVERGADGIVEALS